MTGEWLSRREILAGSGTAIAAGIAGCSGETRSDSGDDPASGTGGSSGTDRPSGTFTAAADTDWPMQTATPEQNPYLSGTAGPTSGIERKWTFEDKGRTPPSVVDETVYLDAGPKLYALDLQSGSVVWEREAEKGQMTPVVTGEAVYTSDGGGVTALDPADGTELWSEERFPDGFFVARAGTLYGTDGESVYAFDPGSREMQWRSQARPPDADDWNRVFRIAVGSKRLYALSGGGTVQAFTLADGERTWVREFSYIKSDVVFTVAHGLVYLSHIVDSTTPTLRAMDAKTGADRWTTVTNGVLTGPTVTEDSLYVQRYVEAEERSPWVALDPTTGQRQTEITAIGQFGDHRPVVADDTLYYFGLRKNLYAVDLSADEVRWEYDGTNYSNTLVVVDGAVLVWEGYSLGVLGEP